MSKSKSLYKQDFPSFSRKGSLDIKSLHGLNPQIFTIQAQSFINQNFFQSNANTTADFLHEKSNHFISNLRKLSQKKLKSERTSSDLKKISNKSATASNGVAASLLDSFPKKLNLRLNSSAAAQSRGTLKNEIKNESLVSNDSMDGKKLEELLEKCIASALGGENPCKLMEETLKKSPKKESRFIDVWRKPLERSLQVLWMKSVENNEIKEDFKAIVRKNEVELEEKSKKIEELQRIVQTQSQQIEILQTKEKQLIQFLLAIKARGIVDLESIFNEEFNNNEEQSCAKKQQEKNCNKSKNGNVIKDISSFNEISQEADISRVNDSEESSFNFFGKSEGSIQINSFIAKKGEEIAKNEKKTAKTSRFKLNLKELQRNCEGCEEKEEVLPSETHNKNFGKNEENSKNVGKNIEINNPANLNLNFKKQKDEKKLSPNINEEMKENLLEKLKNFRKVYEKLAKK